MNNFLNLPPLYPITDATQKLSLSEQVLRFADAGFPLVQFRGKPMSVGDQWRELRKALSQARENGGWPMIVVNDRADLAVIAAAENLTPWGLHLGQTDLPASDAVRLPGLENIHFGASTHNSNEWSSASKVCDHAGVGPIRATPTKLDHDEIIGFNGLSDGCSILRSKGIAPVAIGGLTMNDALLCFQAGTMSLAMTSALSPSTLSDNESRLTEYLWQAQKLRYTEKPILSKGKGVVIVGGSGAGKTTLAEHLARRMGLMAIDLDLQISKRAGCSITEIFSKSEALFRSLELKCLPECMEHASVLALGAGAWQREAIRQLIEKSAWDVLWLAEDPRIAWERVKMVPGRPLASERAEFMQRWRSRLNEWSVLPSLLPLGRSPDELAQILSQQP
ncbi:MAG: thiamine phosphate synthase [Holophagales bacterium]|jgi:thiamine-phosphate diphosphorylase|nr:thiamine phosphate synthase [Holophagales bacterium]